MSKNSKDCPCYYTNVTTINGNDLTTNHINTILPGQAILTASTKAGTIIWGIEE